MSLPEETPEDLAHNEQMKLWVHEMMHHIGSTAEAANLKASAAMFTLCGYMSLVVADISGFSAEKMGALICGYIHVAQQRKRDKEDSQ